MQTIVRMNNQRKTAAAATLLLQHVVGKSSQLKHSVDEPNGAPGWYKIEGIDKILLNEANKFGNVKYL
jgi:hypothetical protein